VWSKPVASCSASPWRSVRLRVPDLARRQ
jgi:hypothetical protein